MSAIKGFIKGFAMTLPLVVVGKVGVKRIIENDDIKTTAAVALVSGGVMALSTSSFGRSPWSFKEWPTSERIGYRLGCVISPAIGAAFGVNETLVAKL